MSRRCRRSGRALLAGIIALGTLLGGPDLPAVGAAPAAAAPSPSAVRPDVARLAAANSRSKAQIDAILADPTAKVGSADRIYYEEPIAAAPAPAGQLVPPGPEAGPPLAEVQTFELHSRPGALRKIYLDFDGHTIANTAWNQYEGVFGKPIVAEPFSIDASTSFSSVELAIIQEVWQRVAEDFSPFDVDVTTRDPGDFGITRSGQLDPSFGTRALITNTWTVASTCGCTGLSYLGAFDDDQQHAYFQPALVFNQRLAGHPKLIAETVSHEVGHHLDLTHDGTPTDAYYGGHGSWAPIMGSGFARPISQWSKGEYPAANNGQDDVQLMQRAGIELLGDDHGNTSTEASPLGDGPRPTATGVITTDADVDVFRVWNAAGPASFSVRPAATGANLDVLLELRASDGTVLARSNPPSTTVTLDQADGLAASLSTNLPTNGDYFVSVTGVGSGDAATGYSGYASIGRYTLDTSLNRPTVTLTSTPNPSTVREPVTFTAQVTPPPGRGSPTGWVTFGDLGGSYCPPVPISSGQATCRALLGAGWKSVIASYSGDQTMASGSSGPLQQRVVADLAAVSLTSRPGPTISGQAVALSSTVTGVAPGGPIPTGSVTFRSDGDRHWCTVELDGGTATCSAPLPVGTHTISARYSGGAWFGEATSASVTHVTTPAPSALAVTSSANPSVAGQLIVLRTTVTVAAPGSPLRLFGGTVTFRSGTTELCAGGVDPSNGGASCGARFDPGSQVITAEHSGDAERLGGTSPPLTQVVTPAEATVSLSVSLPNPSAGQNVQLRASVRAGWPGCCEATGTVTFTAGESTLCAEVPIEDGGALCNRSFPVGSYAFVATYGGDGRVNGGTSISVTYQVTRPRVTVALATSASPVAWGTSVTFTASVLPVVAGTAIPTGTVTFTYNDTVLCREVPLTNGQASCTGALGAVGWSRIGAFYSGDDTFVWATSPDAYQVVTGDPATVAVSTVPGGSVSGQLVELRVLAQGVDGQVPKGYVTLKEGASTLCARVYLVDGAGACSVRLTVGQHSLSADYIGDERYAPGSSPPFTHQVAPAPTTVAVQAAPNPPAARQAQLTATVAVAEPGSGVPSGTVTFREGATVLCSSLPLGQVCTPTLSPGTHPITAIYSGDSQLEGAASPVFDQVILPSGDGFTAVTPNRLLDTRTGLGGWVGPLDAGATRSPLVRGGTTGIPDSATSVMLNVTATGPTADSYLTVYPSGTPRPGTSSLNLEPGRTVPNLVPVVVGADGRVSITNAFGTVHVIVDIVGYHTAVGGSPSSAIMPTRLLDTRNGIGGPAAPITGGTTRQLTVRGGATGVPDSATAVIVNMTVTQPTIAGYLTVHPSEVAQPNASSLNFAVGETVPNLVVARIGADGRISVFNAFGTAHVLADVVGYYAPPSTSTSIPVPGRRLLDTRSGIGGPAAAIGPRTVRVLPVTGIPADATAVVLNVTAVSPTAASYLTVFGGAPPNASNLNFGPGQTRANLVVAELRADGTVSIYNDAGQVHVLADIVGYTR